MNYLSKRQNNQPPFPAKFNQQLDELDAAHSQGWWSGFWFATVGYWLLSLTYVVLQGILEGLELVNNPK